MTDTLEISDGTTTVDFTSADFSLIRWAPAVPAMEDGDSGVYFLPVDEHMEITITGTSASDIMSHITTLTELLRQAQAWQQGEDVDAVLLRVRPYAGSSAGELVVAIIGPVSPGRPMIEYDASFLLAPAVKNLDAKLHFKRLPLWMGSTETETEASSTARAIPYLVNMTAFTDTAPFPWPMDLELEFSSATGTTIIRHDLLVVTQTAGDNKLNLTEGADFTVGSDVTKSSDTYASGTGQLAEFDPTGAAANLWIAPFGISYYAKRIAVYITAKNLSASSVDWDIYVRVITGNSYRDGRRYRLPAGSNTTAYLIPLGIIGTPSDAIYSPFRIYAEPVGSGTTGDELQIDAIGSAVVDEGFCELYLPDVQWSAYGSVLGATLDTWLDINHNLTSKTRPTLTLQVTEGTEYGFPGFKGNARLAGQGQDIGVMVMGVDKNSTQYFYPRATGGTPAALKVLPTLVRSRAYLTPE